MTPHEYEGRDLEAMSFAYNYHRWIADIFASHTRGNLVIEVGSGSGNFSELLLQHGVNHLVAIEPSEKMYEKLSNRFKDNSLVETRKSLFSELVDEYKEKADTIVYVNVLEHIEKDEEELALAYKALKPGGSICIFVPALSWLFSEFDASVGHHRRYHKKELRTLVEKCGFTVTRIHYFDFFGIVPWLIYFRLFKRKLDVRDVNTYDTVVVPFARFVETLILPPIGKNILLIAEKK